MPIDFSPIDLSASRDIYLQITDQLMAAIKDGRLQPGERLPARRETATLLGVAPETVKKAQDELTRLGLLKTHSTRGTFVQEYEERDDVDLQRLADQVEEIREQVNALPERVEGAQEPVRDEIAELRRTIGRVETHLMDLYGRLGHPYPHDAGQPGVSEPLRRSGT